ncbi:DUF6077 domain-containing protein [Porcincola sp. LCP21S3_C12]|uniref:DUF6077 domain-containing protein n=1 Tax=Porcincola sp. LCP21S3_C12 TaxID=3438798 RepID=UPI003F969CAA
MKIALHAAIAAIVLCFLFLCTGSIIQKMRGKKDFSLSGALLLGYVIYFSLFEVICLACEVTLTSLSRLSVIMMTIGTAFMLGGVVYCFRSWLTRLHSLKHRIRVHGWLLAVVIALVLAVCFFALIYTDDSADSDFYVGMASTALYTNTIGRFDPTNGRLLKAINPRYAYALYPIHNAVVADLFHIPAIVAARSVMSVINAFVSCLAYYKLGQVLFAQKTDRNLTAEETGRMGGQGSVLQTRKTDVFTILLLLLNLFSATIYMPGTFLFTRTFEGKHLIVNLVIPLAAAACVAVYRGVPEGTGEQRFVFENLFFLLLAGVCFSASVSVPALMTAAALLPLFVYSKKWKQLLRLFLAELPFLVWAGIYVLNSRRVFILAAYR